MKIKFITVIASIILTCNGYAGGGTNGLNLILDNKLFASAAIGTSTLDIDTSLASNTTFTRGALDKSGGLVELGVGYKHSKNIFTTFSLQVNKLENADIYNLYSSVNYQFSVNKFKPFIGGLVGYSRLEWSKPPHQVRLNKDLTSQSLLYGFQIGAEKKLKNKLSLILKYQFIKYKHEIEIVDNTSNIKHNSEQNILVGLQYLF